MIRSVRGKKCPIAGYRSFQWTSAVRGFVILALRSAARHSETEDILGQKACIVGGKGSLASSLDYALAKQPLWLRELFGEDSKGVPVARRVFRRINPSRQWGDEVYISLNHSYLSPKAISIFLDGERVTSERLLEEIASTIEAEDQVEEPALKKAV